MSQSVVSTTLAADLPNGGVLTIGYPAGKSRGDFLNGVAHYLIVNSDRYNEPDRASFAFNAANIAITFKGPTILKAGSPVFVNLDEAGQNLGEVLPLPANVGAIGMAVLDLGAPQAGVANGIALSQTVTVAASPNAVLNGALVAGGVAKLDVPRTIVATWTGATVFTVEGKDKNGKAIRESSNAPSPFVGEKAFAEVTRAFFSQDVTVATVGTGNAIGLPSWLPAAGHILRELQDGATAAAGIVVPGLPTNVAATAINGDVRGTYTPAVAPDGTKALKLIVALEDPAFQGSAQF